MHDIRRLGLQVFAAPNNLTGEAQIHVEAREIDFVTSFGKNLKALLDILGITRMIRKENNSVLKTKTVKGELQSGDVGEGEEIPMSRYTVEEKPFDTIKIEKYRKGVSLEAILEKGYETAVQDTDDEFKSDLQNVVTDKFYTQLKAGSLTGHETTWQMAVESGKVKKYVTDFANETVAGREGILVTPHLGASTEESEENCAEMAVKEIRDYLENGNIKNSVNYPNCDMGTCVAVGRISLVHSNTPNMISQVTKILGSEGLNF